MQLLSTALWYQLNRIAAVISLALCVYSQRKEKSANSKLTISRRNSEKKKKFPGEISRRHHDLGIENVFTAFRGETKTVMT